MSEVDELTPSAGRSARILARFLPVAATLAAIAFLMFSAASFNRIKAYMDALSFDGGAVSFSRQLFTTLVRIARIAAAILACAAAVLFQSRRRIERLPVQRALAPTRVWIYLLPLVFVYAAAGSVAAVKWVGVRLVHAGRQWSAEQR